MRPLLPLLALLTAASAITLTDFVGQKQPVYHNKERIARGQNAVEGQFPYQVSLQMAGHGHFCTGAIISDRIGATTAYCLQHIDFFISRISAVVGMTDLGHAGVRFPIEQAWIHEQFNIDHSYDLDVGAFSIVGSFSSTSNARIIPLAMAEPPAGAIATASSWTYGSDGRRERLQWTEVGVTDRAACLATYQGSIGINNICVNRAAGESCGQDRGDLLVWNGTLVGIDSWGFGCADLHLPEVYANVATPAVNRFLSQLIEQDEEQYQERDYYDQMAINGI